MKFKTGEPLPEGLVKVLQKIEKENTDFFTIDEALQLLLPEITDETLVIDVLKKAHRYCEETILKMERCKSELEIYMPRG